MDDRDGLLPNPEKPSSEDVVEIHLQPSGPQVCRTAEDQLPNDKAENFLQPSNNAVAGIQDEKKKVEACFYAMIGTGQESDRNDATDLFGKVVLRIVCSTLKYSNVRCPSARDDIFQNVMVKLIRYGNSFDRKRPLEVYIAAIVRHEMLDHISDIRIMKTLMHDISDHRSSATPEDSEDNDSSGQLAQMIESIKLSDRDKEILTWPEDSNKELAKKLGISMATLRVRRSRLKKRLRDLLRDHHKLPDNP